MLIEIGIAISRMLLKDVFVVEVEIFRKMAKIIGEDDYSIKDLVLRVGKAVLIVMLEGIVVLR